MTETAATMTEELLLPSSIPIHIPEVNRNVATIPLSWSQAMVREQVARRHREQGAATLWTTNEIIWFDGDSDSRAVLDEVDSRIAAQSSWVRELEETCLETARRDGDGEGAAPVQLGAREHAVTFVSELANGIRFPEVGIDPDGEISLGWRVDGDVFSVSVSSEGRLSYAGLSETSDCYGTEWMDDQVPREVLRQLDRLIHLRRASNRLYDQAPMDQKLYPKPAAPR